MSARAASVDAGEVAPARLAWVAGFVSLGVLAFQVGLMRALLVASWHHFAFLVISVSLLGFGASGTALCLARRWVMARPGVALGALTALASVSMPVCVRAAQVFPIESQLLPALIWRQIGAWVGYWALLAIPFFLGGSAVGLTLMLARSRVGLVYGANLVGSALGAAVITPVMGVVAPAWLSVVTGAMALPAVAGAVRARAAVVVIVGAAAVIGGAVAVAPPEIRVDEYKYGAFVERLAEAGEAERVSVSLSSRGMVEVWRGEAFHEVPFLSMDAAPPVVSPVVIDKHRAGALLRAGSAAEASAAGRTLMAAPYALAPASPRALLLGEVGGTSVWLASLEGASSITLVQPHAELVEALRSLPDDEGGAVMRLEGLEVSPSAARHFVDHTDKWFDLISLARLERAVAGTGGIGGLAEDHLMTVEGVSAALDALSERGIVTVCRAIQSPPRDNLKLLATFAEALRARGVDRPGDHIVVVRDFLGVCTMVRRTPWSDAEIEAVRRLCAERALTPVWFRGVRYEELNRPDRLPGPGGEPGDWLHHGVGALVGPEHRSFVDRWMFDIRPPTDARPFFLDFCKLGSIPALRRAFGDLWLTRAELAYLFVLVTAVVIAAVGALVTVAPLVGLRSIRRSRGKAATAAYFGSIGLGYLGLEIVALSSIIRLIGDQVLAASATIASFLFFSGLGALCAQRLIGRGWLGRWWVLMSVAVVAAASLVALRAAGDAAGGLTLPVRTAVGVAAVAPMALVMGFPMPLGLARVDVGSASLVPWAWGVNGFASVLAAPASTALAMAWSYDVSAAVAVGLYALAGAALVKLPGGAVRDGQERTGQPTSSDAAGSSNGSPFGDSSMAQL